MKPCAVALAATLLLLPAPAAPLPSSAEHTTGGRTMGTGDEHPTVQGFDREACEQDCREQYGMTPFGLQFNGANRGYHRTRNRLYMRCIQECNRRFWDAFDRETEQLQEEADSFGLPQ
jgi:hypothetical protein